jgi:ADP-ribosyl-[dinitrogen reductase] hydrolase
MAAVSERDRCRGAMLGLAVGDALGAPLEGAPPAVAAAAVAAGIEMSGGGCWAAGEWTDDTALALRLAESIAERGLLDSDDVGRRYIRWANAGGKGIGRTTRSALVGAVNAEDARARARAHYQASNLAAGNGTVMRATPVGLAARTLAEGVDAARHDAELTHADPAAGATSAALCASLLAVREGADALAAAHAQVEGHPPLVAALEAVAAGDEAAVSGLAVGPQAGACWTTLSVALRAVTAAHEFESGVSWAIARGGDVDTNAAVAGALLGCQHGVSAIPARWLARLRARERIERAADRLCSSARRDTRARLLITPAPHRASAQ